QLKRSLQHACGCTSGHCYGKWRWSAVAAQCLQMLPISCASHQFPPAVIQHAVWLHVRFTLSYRDVENLLAERGAEVSYASIRRSVLKFRADDRPPPSATPAETNNSLASGRDGGADCRQEDVFLARRG